MPSNRKHQVYLYCFAKAVEKIPCTVIDGICHGCAAGSQSLEHHTGCRISYTFQVGKMPADKEWVDRTTQQLCKFEGEGSVNCSELDFLWEKCQEKWMPLVRGALMRRFDMFPSYWEKCI